MPIATTDVKFYYTGGAANSNPNASLGGTLSSVEITAGLHTIFDKVGGDESSAGDIEYRCIGIKNNHGSLTWEAVRAFISQQTTGEDVIAIAVETPGGGGTVQTVVNESTAPAALAFSEPGSRETGLVCTGNGDTAGNIGSGKWVAIWIRRTVPAGANAFNNNPFEITVSGDTAA
jgi:hypothetical protein